MSRFASAVAVLACVTMVATPVSAACWEPEEYEAARMRDLQTVLMVSALKCGRADATMPAAYNRWVGRAKEKLVEGEQKLLAHFVREGDRAKYDKFTTALANRYSEYADDPKFCARAKVLMEADEKQNGVLAELALLINSKPAGVEEVCPVKRPTGSQIIVSPFAPLPEPGGAAVATAAVTAPAAAGTGTAATGTAATGTAASAPADAAAPAAQQTAAAPQAAAAAPAADPVVAAAPAAAPAPAAASVTPNP